MIKLFAFCAIAASLLAPSAYANAGDDKTASLLEALNADIDPANVPKGYEFYIAQPIAKSDEDVRRDVAGRVELRFTRTADSTDTPLPEQSWEGFQYYVLSEPAASVTFAMTEAEAAENLVNMRGLESQRGEFNPKAWRSSFTVKARVAGGNVQPLRCVAADTLVGCLAVANAAPVVIHLMLQEPKLASARTDGERQALATARVQQEVGGLLAAAQSHLAAALSDSNSSVAR